MTAKVSKGGAFLHIPKTGGMWVQAVLEKAGIFGRQIGHEHGCDHREKWAFTVVRDPAQWWLSLWKYRTDTGWPMLSGDHPLAPINNIKETDPAIWLIRAVHDLPGFCGQLYQQYVDNADYVLQTEQLPTQLGLLAKQVGWPNLDLLTPRENVGQAKIDLSCLDLGPVYQAEKVARSIWHRAGLEPQDNYSI